MHTLQEPLRNFANADAVVGQHRGFDGQLGKFTADFKRILENAGVKILPISYQAPNMNAVAERSVRTVKDECLGHMILFGESHLRRAIEEYVAHYHSERAHQGLGNELIEPGHDSRTGDVVESERLGGLLRSYRRAA